MTLTRPVSSVLSFVLSCIVYGNTTSKSTYCIKTNGAGILVVDGKSTPWTYLQGEVHKGMGALLSPSERYGAISTRLLLRLQQGNVFSKKPHRDCTSNVVLLALEASRYPLFGVWQCRFPKFGWGFTIGFPRFIAATNPRSSSSSRLSFVLSSHR